MGFTLKRVVVQDAITPVDPATVVRLVPKT